MSCRRRYKIHIPNVWEKTLMTEIAGTVFQNMLNDITAGSVIGILLGFAIVVMRRKT